ncbi:MAG: glutamate--tRNA ligase [Candidatus Cloacimonetes bacterium]|nr:glutamate--tRNA ligase [Candidatus Cloacimonadota bacterium]
MSNDIRVRFAPSPTGYLHVGGLRTALYNYLYARKVGGKFILRIEDTDQARYVEGAVENLLATMKLVGLQADEGPEKGGEFGPYYQSERTELYRKYAAELIAKGAAYYCFCSSEDLAQLREEQLKDGYTTGYDGRCRNISPEDAEKRVAAGEDYVIRLKTPDEGVITFYDMVREKVTFGWDMVDDQVLIKSDGFPTYHLANVVDDHLMQISHVIRGEEWLSSVPKHLYLYEQLGWKPPKMAHLPLLLNPDKSKLSKRQGDVAVEDYLNKGFLVETLLNFIALLGWHAKGDREIFSLAELEKEFSLKRVSKAGAVFDLEKLRWMNGHYLKTLPLEQVIEAAKPFFLEEFGELEPDVLSEFIDYSRPRAATMLEMPEECKTFRAEITYSEEDRAILQDATSQAMFGFWADELSLQSNWTTDAVNGLLKKTYEKFGVQGKKLYFPLRLALFGSPHGPELDKIIKLAGRERCIIRLKKVRSEK